MKCVVTFTAVHYVMKAEKILKGKGMRVRLIPTPRHISSDCGMALEIADAGEDINAVRARMREEGFSEAEEVHEVR